MRRQIGAHRGDRDIAVKIDRRIGTGQGWRLLRAALDPEEFLARRRDLRGKSERGVATKPLRRDAVALDVGGRAGREIDVVKQAVVGGIPQGAVQQVPDDHHAILARSLERIGQFVRLRPHELRQGNRRYSVQSSLQGRTDSAGIQHVFGSVVAPVHPRQHQIGLGPLQHVIKSGQHAIGRAAFGGKAAIRQLGDHHRTRITDAMANAGLLEGRGYGPHLAPGSGNFGGDVLQDRKTRGVDAVVIGDQNAHLPALPLDCFH